MTLLRSCTKPLHSPTTSTMHPSAKQGILIHHHTTTIFSILRCWMLSWSISGHCLCNVVTMQCVSQHCVLLVLPCLAPRPVPSCCQPRPGCSRYRGRKVQLQAETRKNMRRHFSVHNISFIARHQHQGVQWALCLHDQLNSGEQRSVASDTRAGPQLVFYTQILLKQFWAGLPSSHHTGHWVLAWRFHHFAMMIGTRQCRVVCPVSPFSTHTWYSW